MMKGKITISKLHCSDSDSSIQITIEDQKSGVQIMDVRLSLSDFADAITGLGYMDCEFDCRGTKFIGATREIKRESIPEIGPFNRGVSKKTALAPYETEGWNANYDDYGNQHRYSHAEKSYLVTFTRFVDEKGEPIL